MKLACIIKVRQVQGLPQKAYYRSKVFFAFSAVLIILALDFEVCSGMCAYGASCGSLRTYMDTSAVTAYPNLIGL